MNEGGSAGSEGSRGSRRRWTVAGTVTIATSMELLDISIVNVAIPAIAGNLGITQDESTWILTAYLIANAIVIPMSGWLAIRFGRKLYYMASVAAFTISSLLCGLAPDLKLLIFFRVLQGAAGGGLGPSEQSILADTFPGERTSLAFALYGMAIVLAPTLGPTLGGYLTDNFGWRWIFFINIPAGIISLLLSHRNLVDPAYLKTREASKTAIDYTGLAFLVIALGALQVVLDRGQRLDWFESSLISALATLAAAGLVALLIWEWRQPNPIINLKLFAYRNFSTAFVMMTMLAAVLYGTMLMIPEFLQLMLGYNAEQTGLTLWPMALVILPLMPVVAWTMRKIDARVVLVFGFILTACALFYVARNLNLSISRTDATMFIVYEAIGMSFAFVPVTTVAYHGVPGERNNEISSLLNFGRTLGGSIGISFVTTVLVRGSQAHQARLADNITSYNPLLRNYETAHHAAFSNAGASPAAIRAETASGLYHAVISQAVVLSYLDIFRIFGLLALCTTALAFLMTRPPQRTGARPSRADSIDPVRKIETSR